MDNSAYLADICAKMGVQLSPEMLNSFMVYKDMLLEWNNKINLTAITDEREIMQKHFADSVSVLAGAEIAEGESVIDVGTGAGFPGLPIKIARPDIRLTLLDSLNKRVDFLNEVCGRIGLKETACAHMRAEDGGRTDGLRDSFGVCVSRAVARLNVLSEYCLPFVAVGGRFISLKGPDSAQEAAEAENAVKALGGEISEIKKISIPDTDITHSLIIIKKIIQTPANYPRKAGKALKKPII